MGKTKRGKGTKPYGSGRPRWSSLAICTDSASPHEVTLVQKTLEALWVTNFPRA